jgi:type IV pilus assembly protein PilV
MNASPKTSSHAEGGFTLIELLMAMLILTVGLLGLLQSVIISYEHSLRNRLRDEAVAIAEEQLNEMKQQAAFLRCTTVSRVISGVTRPYAVARRFHSLGDDTEKLTVAVSWGFKNLSTTHEIYTIKKKR